MGRRARIAAVCFAVLSVGAAWAQTSSGEVRAGMAEVLEPRLYFETAGRGEAVVLIHGGGLDCRMWDRQFEVLASNYQVIRYDVRGFGRSDAPDKPYSDHGDLLQVLDYLKVGKAHLVGLSLGGRIAIDFALTHPERVLSLVLAGPGVSGFRFSPDSSARFLSQVRAAQKGAWEEALNLWLTDPYMSPAMEQEALRPRLARIARDNLKTLLQNWMLQIDLDPPAIGRLQELRVPVLLVVGERDVPDIQAIAKLLQEKIPALQRIDVPGSGHMVNLEKPEAFDSAISEFLARQAPGAERD